MASSTVVICRCIVAAKRAMGESAASGLSTPRVAVSWFCRPTRGFGPAARIAGGPIRVERGVNHGFDVDLPGPQVRPDTARVGWLSRSSWWPRRWCRAGDLRLQTHTRWVKSPRRCGCPGWSAQPPGPVRQSTGHAGLPGLDPAHVRCWLVVDDRFGVGRVLHQGQQVPGRR